MAAESAFRGPSAVPGGPPIPPGNCRDDPWRANCRRRLARPRSL